ncbi:hypothetical protein [Mailhella massiliensis]|uniref:hypothetical protein n=1 Tax=Mailhella massiliensis TaxID=1903261 RepID=UPI0023F5511E|nr:hypothetical protein [Mailhella massiliensis]
MLYFKPAKLGDAGLDDRELREDRKACLVFGPCGVGAKALYLNSLFLDRRFYVPVSNIRRAYKRVAMSKGAFTGKGIFGSIPYLVVEYGRGESVQCTFKHERHVDMMIAEIQRRFPHIRTMSEAAARRLAEARAEEEARYRKNLSPEAQASLEKLRRAKAFLEERPDLATRLAAASKARRVDQMTNPMHKWVALAIFCLALAASVYGVYVWSTGSGDYGLCITLVGLAALFFFAGANVLPTAHNNRRAIIAALDKARADVQEYISTYPDFPLPARYAHPATLARMIRSIREGRSETVPEAYEDMKAVLKSLNSSVRVSQTEYDEVVAVKPMFLLENYE